jgi:hypothetical protein
MGGRPRRLLGPTVGSAVVLAVFAFVLWGVALWASWGGSCPNSEASAGLDKGISAWPPAAQCANPHGGTFWHEALPWATWVIGGLIMIAAAILRTGLIVAIRDLRRPAQVAAAPTAPLRDASLPGGGPSGGYPTTRGDDDERDQRAIAA